MESKDFVRRFYGAVILLDRLGTKGIWKKEPEKAVEVWNSFTSKVRNMEKELMETDIAKKFGMQEEIFVFSDTMVVLFRMENNTSKFDLLKMCANFSSIILNVGFLKEIYFRGCISIGEYYKAASGESIIGPAIDEAAQYFASPTWIGVSLAPSAHIAVKDEPNQTRYMMFNYDIPLHEGTEHNGIAIDWFTKYPEMLETIRMRLIQLIEQTYDVKVAFIYRNTLDFLDYIVSKSTSNKD